VSRKLKIPINTISSGKGDLDMVNGGYKRH
jgi:hypothetical protein